MPGLIGVPVVKRIVSGDWMIGFYEEFESFILPDGHLHQDFVQLIKFCEAKSIAKGFRREIVIQNFPLLCAIRPEEKSLYISTRRLSRELSLLKLHDFLPVLNDVEIDKHIFKLKEQIIEFENLFANKV
jgi:hypothetical protein